MDKIKMYREFLNRRIKNISIQITGAGTECIKEYWEIKKFDAEHCLEMFDDIMTEQEVTNV